MGRVDGKRVIVIGAAHGMGRATAQMMAREGAHVVVADVLADDADKVAQEIRLAGGAAQAMWVDIGEEAAVQTLIGAAVDTLGGLDVLHNNAAALGDPVAAPDGANGVLDIPTEAWDRTMQVNLRGIWLACRYAVPHMIRAGGGSIINTASLAATQLMTTSGAYSVSKGAVNTLTLAIATQYGRFGIRANAINPGMIRTRHLPLEYERMLVRHNLMPRIGEPDDIAALATYLASEESGYVTGQLLTIDGGFSVHGPTYVDLLALADGEAPQDPEAAG
jgi:NAD(P)-dependent dehydrogenase (short-subunit alcohol dehydrogenase family)